MNEIIEYNITEIVQPIVKRKRMNIEELAKTLQHSHLNTELNAKCYETFETWLNSFGTWIYLGLKKVSFTNLIYTRTDPFETTQYFHYLFAHACTEFTDQMKGTLQTLLMMWRNLNPQYDDVPMKTQKSITHKDYDVSTLHFCD